MCLVKYRQDDLNTLEGMLSLFFNDNLIGI